MVALVGPFGSFHFAQQGVHLGQGEAAVGADGAVAGHGGEEFVAAGGDHFAGGEVAQFGEEGADEFADGGRGEEGRDAAHGKFLGAGGADLEAHAGEEVGVFLGAGHVLGADAEDSGDEQALHAGGAVE